MSFLPPEPQAIRQKPPVLRPTNHETRNTAFSALLECQESIWRNVIESFFTRRIEPLSLET